VLTRVKAASLLAVPALLLGVAATNVPAATAGAPARAHLDKVGSTFLETHGMWLRSTTGKRIFTDVFVDRFSWREHPAFEDMQVDLGRGHENHLWDFDLNGQKNFSFDVTTGKGRLTAGTAVMGGFGRINLRLTRRGTPSMRSCGAGLAENITPVRIRGTFAFKTHTSGAAVPWGSLGGHDKVMTLTGRNTVITDYGNPANACFNPPSTCASQTGWNGPGGVHGLIVGSSFVSNGKQRGFLDAFTTHTLRGARGPQRDDDVFRSFPAPTIVTSPTGESVAVVSKDRHGVSGSASLASVGPVKTRHRTCDGGTMKDQSWQASYTNGTTPLTLREEVGRALTQRNSANGADIFIDSVGTQPASIGDRRPAVAGPLAVRQHEIRRTTIAAWNAQK
jgi:hypothetical protein